MGGCCQARADRGCRPHYGHLRFARRLSALGFGIFRNARGGREHAAVPDDRRAAAFRRRDTVLCAQNRRRIESDPRPMALFRRSRAAAYVCGKRRYGVRRAMGGLGPGCVAAGYLAALDRSVRRFRRAMAASSGMVRVGLGLRRDDPARRSVRSARASDRCARAVGGESMLGAWLRIEPAHGACPRARWRAPRF